ncbi:MAG: helix-turn-helix domain-containing protein [Pseudomonadota bacterium]
MQLGGHDHRKLFQQGVQHFNVRLKNIMGKESIASFARGCNIHPSTIRKYLNTNALPSIDKIEAIAKYTERSLAWLITGEEEKVHTPARSQSPDEIKKWWGIISEALTAEQKEKIIQAFKLGGVNAIFISTWIENE